MMDGPTRHVALAAALLAGALLAPTGCGDPPAAQPAQEHAADAAGDGHRAPANTPFARIVAGIDARGSAGAEEAWADGRATLLLFAASW